MTTRHTATRRLWLLVVAVVAFAGLTVQAPQVQALTVTEMATDVINGTYTPSELDACAASAACTDMISGGDSVQAEGLGTSETESQVNAALGADAVTASTLSASGGCPAGSTNYFTGRWWANKGDLGNTNYRWHWAVWFCRNNNTDKITKWLQKKDYITNAAWYVEWTNDQVTAMTPGNSGMPVGVAGAYRQRHVKLVFVVQVVPINFYPHGKFYIYGDGRTPLVSGAAR